MPFTDMYTFSALKTSFLLKAEDICYTYRNFYKVLIKRMEDK